MTQMLMEFETLDAEDVKEIYNNTWDIERKRARLLEVENRYKYTPPTPPPPPEITDDRPGLGVVST